MPEAVLEWGIALILWLQGVASWPVLPLSLLTFTGNLEFYLLVLPVLYWCVNGRLGLRVAVALMISVGVNSLFKLMLHDPRPYWLDPQVALLTNPESSFGIPSGHAQNAVVLWGVVAHFYGRRWLWGLAGGLALLVGFSRIYLGVHFPTDVLAGWALGGLLLVLLIRLEAPALAWLRRQRVGRQVGVLFGLSLVMLLTGTALLLAVQSTWQLPPVWVDNALLAAPDHPIHPFSGSDFIIGAGAFFGFTAGALLLNGRQPFEAGGPWLKRAGRYLVGVVGVAALWLGLNVLGQMLPPESRLLTIAFDYLTFAVVGLWASYLAPLIFFRLGLAQQPALTAAAAAD